MRKFWPDPASGGGIEVWHGSVQEEFPWPDDHFACVVTSPPYWGLRDYGLEPEIWGGPAPAFGGSGWRGCLGLEPTPELYVQHLVEVFRKIKRVLAPWGTVWLNMGDSYAGSGGAHKEYHANPGLSNSFNRQGIPHYGDLEMPERYLAPKGLKPKDLVGVPWMVAFALRADGGWLRMDGIWNKPNPMPESCTDRPTRSHEYLFILSQSGNSLYWTHREGRGTQSRPKPDYRYKHITGYEVAEEPPNWKQSIITCPFCEGTGKRSILVGDLFGEQTMKAPCDACNNPEPDEEDTGGHEGREPRKGEVWKWKRINLWRGHDYFYDADAVREKWTDNNKHDIYRALYGHKKYGGKWDERIGGRLPEARICGNPSLGRNRRSVWTIPTKSYKDAHFATFPPDLVIPCIKAGAPIKICSKCGAPWERVTEIEYTPSSRGHIGKKIEREMIEKISPMAGMIRKDKQIKTLGFQPTCECPPATGGGGGETKKAIVFDPFGGSGTVAEVAYKLGCDAVVLDVSEKYCELAVKRLEHSVMQEAMF